MDGFKRVDEQVIVSTGELCKLLEISDRTLTDWKREGLVQYSRGWWDLKKVLKWRGEIYSGDSEVSRSINLQQKKLEAEVSYKEAQSELTRIKVDFENGRYIEKDDIEAELSRFFLVFKKSILSLSRKLSGEVSQYVPPIEARRIEKNLSETINDALEQISTGGVYNAKKKRTKAT